MTMRQRVDVNLDELDQIIDRSTRAPLSESEGKKLKTALHAMAERLVRKRNTEKTSAVLPQIVRPQANRMATNRLQPVMDAIVLLRLVVPKRLPSHTPRSIPATSVRNAVKEKCTV
jgi:hypothetical protein